jgi:Protein of unknown function (DUF1574).
MKKFLKYLAVFLLPIAILFIACEVLLWNIPNDYRKKRQYLDDHSQEVEVLILGASHALTGLNPEYFSYKAYNAAYVSQTFDVDYLILEKYKDQWNNLKYIILPVSYPSLYEQLHTTSDYWRLNDYARYADLPTATDMWYRSELLNNKLWYNLYRIADYYLLGNPAIVCDDNGWRRKPYNPEIDMADSGKTAAKRHTIEDSACLKDNLRLLNEIIRFCSERKVQLILCTLPAYHTYVDNLDEKQYREFIETTRTIADENPNVYYLNLLNDPDFTIEDFSDSDHLSDSGAEKASIILNDCIEEGEEYIFSEQ